MGLFTNVTTNPAKVALLAASYVIANSDGTASVVIFTDSEYAIETYKADVMASTLKGCRRCSVLQDIDAPIAGAQVNVAAVVNSLLETYGKRFTYLLAVNSAYITGAQVALFGAGCRAINHRSRSRPATATRPSSSGSGQGSTRRRRSPSLCTCKAGSSLMR